MEEKNEQQIVLEQYRIYSDAKERFIDRHFATNRFYLVLNIVMLIATYILNTIIPDYQPAIIMCLVGFSISLMWLLNIDSYQMLIKVKYSSVLEYLETKLPEQPYNKEFADYVQLKKKNKWIVFGDLQKMLTILIMGIYLVVLLVTITNIIKINIM